MLYNLNEEDVGPALSEKRFDVCIVGAGVAGITLALRLAGAGKSVLLLEGGGKEISAESQEVYRGENVGLAYYDLRTCRLRYLGGTSNHWNGRCRTLDAHDFEQKDHIPFSGWPITKADLLPYEEETYDVLDIPRRTPPDTAFPSSNGSLKFFRFVFSAPTRFRVKYSADLERSGGIHLVLNANAIDYKLDAAGRRVAQVVCRSHARPRRDHVFRASRFVLAMGGIENARALLNADSQIPGGIGNQHDLVGRFFVEHLGTLTGVYWEREPVGGRRFVAPSLALINRERIGNCGLIMQGYIRWSAGRANVEFENVPEAKRRFEMDAVREIIETTGMAGRDVVFSPIRAQWEQIPNPESRVTVSDDLDKFGKRTTYLDWQWTPMERKTIRVCMLELGKALARGDTGRVKIVDWVLDDDLPFPNTPEPASRHHMGTTRMSNDPATGVVDRNCRVFGVDNLYIAGSSVFTTGGHANPTFTIVQLALRLGDHLNGLGP